MRTCPVCGYVEPQHPLRESKDRIVCVLNEDTDDYRVGRAYCPSCESVWDEYVNKHTGEIQNEVVAISRGME